uniref:Uncharacterized protein n=1 Tax=Parascaris equorum TaxID=6256 RepID=A0A914S5F4_PAREQ
MSPACRLAVSICVGSPPKHRTCLLKAPSQTKRTTRKEALTKLKHPSHERRRFQYEKLASNISHPRCLQCSSHSFSDIVRCVQQAGRHFCSKTVPPRKLRKCVAHEA